MIRIMGREVPGGCRVIRGRLMGDDQELTERPPTGTAGSRAGVPADAVMLPSGTVVPADPMSDADWAARCAAWDLTGAGVDAGGDAEELAALGADALGADA